MLTLPPPPPPPNTHPPPHCCGRHVSAQYRPVPHPPLTVAATKRRSCIGWNSTSGAVCLPVCSRHQESCPLASLPGEVAITCLSSVGREPISPSRFKRNVPMNTSYWTGGWGQRRRGQLFLFCTPRLPWKHLAAQ